MSREAKKSISYRLAISSLACVSLVACKPSKGQSNNESAPKPVASDPQPDPAKPTVSAEADIDLAAGGAAWKGWRAKGPAGSKAVDDGVGGISVGTDTFQITITQGDLHLPELKAGAKAGAEMSKGKVTFTTDKPDDLEYVTETPNADGLPIKSVGFGLYVSVGDKKVGCMGVLDEEHIATAKKLCRSLAKS